MMKMSDLIYNERIAYDNLIWALQQESIDDEDIAYLQREYHEAHIALVKAQVEKIKQG